MPLIIFLNFYYYHFRGVVSSGGWGCSYHCPQVSVPFYFPKCPYVPRIVLWFSKITLLFPRSAFLCPGIALLFSRSAFLFLNNSLFFPEHYNIFIVHFILCFGMLFPLRAPSLCGFIRKGDMTVFGFLAGICSSVFSYLNAPDSTSQTHPARCMYHLDTLSSYFGEIVRCCCYFSVSSVFFPNILR